MVELRLGYLLILVFFVGAPPPLFSIFTMLIVNKVTILEFDLKGNCNLRLIKNVRLFHTQLKLIILVGVHVCVYIRICICIYITYMYMYIYYICVCIHIICFILTLKKNIEKYKRYKEIFQMKV